MGDLEPVYLQKLSSIPKQSFLFGPSPIQYLPRLSKSVSTNGDVKIYAKRDDCNSGLAYGGNKVRKLEYLVADALAKGCDTLVSVGSDHPLGGLGFTNWIVELAEQEKQLGIFFDTLIVCSVTGSSHAGLIVGAVAEGKGRKIIGIDASGKPAATKEQVARIARNTAALLDPKLDIPDSAILDERFHEGIYGIPGPSTLDAMKLAAQTDAMITDPVYEGKSMAGLIQLVKEGSISKSSNVLYAHLGGQPALAAYSSYFDS